MKFLVTGISHKTSPVALREKFYLEPAERELFLSELHHEPAVTEALIISTCNRTEIYARMTGEVPSLLIGRLCALKGIALTPELSKCFYSHAGQAAALHLFSVACGLDSLIVGEKEILGQVKAAIELSRKKQLMFESMVFMNWVLILCALVYYGDRGGIAYVRQQHVPADERPLGCLSR